MKRSTRLLSLLLAALMLLTALPAVSAAEDAIQSVTVTFIPPTEGTEIKSLTSSDFQDVVTVPSTDPYTVCDAYWMNKEGTEAFDPNQTPGATFEAGKTYYIFIEIEAKPGYEFTVIPEYTLVEGVEEETNLTPSGNFTIKASVKAKEKAPVPEAIAIGSASVTLTVPEAGTSSETKPAITLPDGANYEVEACLWNQEDGSHAEKDTLVPYTFKAGQTYTFWATLKAKEGYYFESAATVALSGCTQKGDLDIYTNATFTYSCIVLIASVKIAEAETCTITFDANGGTGKMDPVSVNKGAEYELPACSFIAPEGKEFDKWDKGAVGDKITISADTVIKALWKNKPVEACTISFDANGGTGKMDPVSVSKGTEYELPACSFTAPDGQEFDCWDKGAVGDKITISADTTVKAQWKDKAVETCTITFNPNGGSGKMASVTVEKGSKYTLPKCTFTPPYSSTFTKWNLGNVGAKITITADTILKAQWKIVKTNPKLTAKNKSFKIKTKTKKYTVTLKDSKGKAIKGAKLTLKVNKKTYTAKTNSKGKATFKLKLTKKGKFNATITYAGNKYFKKTTKTVKFTVK